MTLVLWWGIVLGSVAAAAEGDRPAFPFFEPVRPPRAIQVMAHHGAMAPAPITPRESWSSPSPTASNGSRLT